jgi:capsular polysaccharide transport system permease protein
MRDAALKKHAPGKVAAPVSPPLQIVPPAGHARLRRRHLGVLLSFFVLVILPLATVLTYLETRAADQYASTLGFSVRQEKTTSPIELLGGISALSAGSSKDTDILFDFIQSQEMISLVDAALDLRQIYGNPVGDPVFALAPDSAIEDLVAYWPRMLRIAYDPGTGLIKVEARAFTALDAQAIAAEVFRQSDIMINQLSAIAREDTIRHAQDELEKSVNRLKLARQAIVAFRNETQIMDPTADIQSQMGLLNNLQTQLAEALINMDLLREITRENDPRVEQARRRIEVIEKRISEERRKFGIASSSDRTAFSTLISDHEALIVDREFAEKAYIAALSSYDLAVAEARRQSRYLAAHVSPTLAESPQYPQRLMLAGVAALFLGLAWAIGVLVIYSIRGRR